MGLTWQSTKHPGVRFREHPERKHGIGPDKYFAIRAQVGGKRREEGLGWASEGWSAQKAAGVLADLKKAHTTGEGAKTLQEKREIADTERQEAEAQRLAEEAEQGRLNRENLPFNVLFTEHYYQTTEGKSKTSRRTEEGLYRLWIAPAIGRLPLKDIRVMHLEGIKLNILKAGRSTRTAEYTLAVVNQVFNFALDNNFFNGRAPIDKKLRKSVRRDNKRLRYLTHEEAALLVAALMERSKDLHDIAQMSLQSGARFSEIANLLWASVDLDKGTVSYLNTKSGRDRTVYLTEGLKAILRERGPGRANELVFPGRSDQPMKEVSRSFDRTVHELGFNDDVEDRKQRVCFHSLRHTCASWMVEAGAPLYVVKAQLGHESMSMTERYSHLSPDAMLQATKALEAGMKRKPAKVINLMSRS